MFGGERLDVDQDEVIRKLINLHGQGGNSKKFPHEFDNEVIEVAAKNRKEQLRITLTVSSLVYKEGLDFDKYSYTLVRPKNWWSANSEPQHCMYAESFNQETRAFRCINSHGENDNPRPVCHETEVNYLNKVSINVDII